MGVIVIHEGVIHENFLMRIYAQKPAPGLHKGKNRRFKNIFILHLEQKMGLYMKGVIHEGVIHEALQ